MSLNLAYLAAGKLHLKEGDGEARIVESQFGRTLRERALRSEQRHGWKARGGAASFLGGVLWGRAGQEAGGLRIAITGVSPGREAGEVLYTLETTEVAGAFAVRGGGADEQRLFHTAEKRVRDLRAAPGRTDMVCSVAAGHGSANIAIRPVDGTQITEVTEGDSLDICPSWIPGEGRRILFQSAGVGRDRDGLPGGQGPFMIQQLDLETGELTSLAEEPKSDLLGPKMDGQGNLYYIRRPYGPKRGLAALGRGLLDFFLIPFRLVFAIFQYLNFFTMMYTGKPMASVGEVKQEQFDMKRMMIWGNVVDAEKMIREGRRAGEEAPSLVPRSWQLIRRKPGGDGEVIARGVLSFDLAGDGSVVHSNGSAIYVIGPDGKSRHLLTDTFIEQVVILG